MTLHFPGLPRLRVSQGRCSRGWWRVHGPGARFTLDKASGFFGGFPDWKNMAGNTVQMILGVKTLDFLVNGSLKQCSSPNDNWIVTHKTITVIGIFGGSSHES
jgi:hypothetical protein